MASGVDDLDYALAVSLQDQYQQDSPVIIDCTQPVSTPQLTSCSTSRARGIVDERWELMDPNPNIHDLFVDFDQMFFNSKLMSRGVVVSWSYKMTRCAGVCSYQPREGFCSVRLSQPLLKLRPRRDLVETLLHEMIHAYLFVTHNNTDHDGHGPNFQSHMHRINSITGANITIYHTFKDEVRAQQKHWWKCDGPCQHRQPFFGIVRRAMNRAPSSRDPWWTQHLKTCGGTFTKIKEPDNYKKKKTKPGEGSKSLGKGKSATPPADNNLKITDMFKNVSKVETVILDSDSDSEEKRDTRREKMLAAVEKRLGKKPKQIAKKRQSVIDIQQLRSVKKPKLGISLHQHDSLVDSNTTVIDLSDDSQQSSQSSQHDVIDLELESSSAHHTSQPSASSPSHVKTCPVCGAEDIPAVIINAHIAACLDEVNDDF